MKFLLINGKTIWKRFLTVLGSAFSALSVILSFRTWDEIGIKTFTAKVIIFFLIFLISVLVSILWIRFQTEHQVWKNGCGEISVCYNDLMKISFSDKISSYRNIVISVNTAFDTLVDADITVTHPLVSPNSLHGIWIQQFLEHSKWSRETLGSEIKKALKDITPSYYTKKSRGNNAVYEIGTVVPISYKTGLTFFLIAVANYDSTNVAHSTKQDIVHCAEQLVKYCDAHGNGYDVYIPLFGTRLSRANLTYQKALKIIQNIFELNEEFIHCKMKIVIYEKDRSNISLFE